MTLKQLAKKLDKHRDKWAEIEFKTGITQQTIRNIIKDPDKPRHKSTIAMLVNFFTGEQAD